MIPIVCQEFRLQVGRGIEKARKIWREGVMLQKALSTRVERLCSKLIIVMII